MKVFIVEDDEVYAKYLKHFVELNPDYEAQVFSTGKDFLQNLNVNDQVVTLDYTLPDISCEKLIKEIRKLNSQIQIIVISAQEEISTAVKLLKNGVYDYIEKNEDTRAKLLNTLKHVAENQSLKMELENLRSEVKNKYGFRSILIGNDSSMNKVFTLMEKAVKSNITVSITGETGTGKELVARAIHYNSSFGNKKIVSVNMSAIPTGLIESELFGHEKGAFTGAQTTRIGKFEEAQGGTLFLDEIAELNLEVQAKLLRALQDREIIRVGGNKAIKLNVRIIVATHKNLFDEVKKGNFREDLYYRILGLPILIPPLRDRAGDKIILAKHFLEAFCLDNSFEIKEVSKRAKEKILNYHWPGNVRELKAVIELAAVMSNNHLIEEEDIMLNSSNNSLQILEQEMTLDEYTRHIISFYLNKHNSNVVEVAKKLNVGKSTIYRMIKEGKVSKE